MSSVHSATLAKNKKPCCWCINFRIFWYRGITVLDSAAEPRANATCDCRNFTHQCIAAKSDRRFFNITRCITTMFFFLLSRLVQPGAVKLVLWRHCMHEIQVHPVTSENQFHCTRLYMYKCLTRTYTYDNVFPFFFFPGSGTVVLYHAFLLQSRLCRMHDAQLCSLTSVSPLSSTRFTKSLALGKFASPTLPVYWLQLWHASTLFHLSSHCDRNWWGISLGFCLCLGHFYPQ